jgi:hypothetical protein
MECIFCIDSTSPRQPPAEMDFAWLSNSAGDVSHLNFEVFRIATLFRRATLFCNFAALLSFATVLSVLFLMSAHGQFATASYTHDFASIASTRNPGENWKSGMD